MLSTQERQGKGKVSLLKAKPLPKDSRFNFKKADGPKNTRCVLRILEAKDLLASDANSGKSDPVCFVWCGPEGMEPDFDAEGDKKSIEERGIRMTEVKNTTLEPIWNEEIQVITQSSH